VIPSNRAVFLSYASQDAEAARWICDAPRKLASRCGSIRADSGVVMPGIQPSASGSRPAISSSVPVISANSNARAEGYFPAGVEARRRPPASETRRSDRCIATRALDDRLRFTSFGIALIAQRNLLVAHHTGVSTENIGEIGGPCRDRTYDQLINRRLFVSLISSAKTQKRPFTL
jgi:hypothetical protein